MPSNIEMNVLYDSTVAINESIHEVIKTIVEAALIVLVVITLFLVHCVPYSSQLSLSRFH